jgi:lysophospholipase L1-like esterase
MIEVKNLLLIGDSKFAETGVGSYNPRLCAMLSNKYPNQLWRETPSRMAVGGRTVATTQDNIDSFLASAVGEPALILINLGANDCDDSPIEANWKADLTYIINAINIKYPIKPIYYTQAWRKDYDTECLMLIGWASAVFAGFSNCYLGANEFTALKASDEGLIETKDGIHPTDLGVKNSVNLWANIL